MKFKSFLKFTFVFLILLAVQLIIIANIKVFITDYEGNISIYENTYNAELSDDGIVANLIENGDFSLAAPSDIEEIPEKDYLLDILSELYDLTKEEADTFLMTYTKNKMVNILKKNYNYGDIFYMDVSDPFMFDRDDYIDSNRGEYPASLIIFTEDLKNIYFTRFLSGDSCEESKDKSLSTNFKVAEAEVRERLSKMGILNRYDVDFTSIRNTWFDDYRYDKEQFYFILEDYKNSIKIQYNHQCGKLYHLELGFVDQEQFTY